MCGNEGSGDQRQSEDIVEGWEVHDDDIVGKSLLCKSKDLKK
jgi:hypothetical protein